MSSRSLIKIARWPLQIRSNAPDADIFVLGLPDNVNTALGRPAAYIGNLTSVITDLQASGFQKLTYLPIPASVMQVPGTASSLPGSLPACLSHVYILHMHACITALSSNPSLSPCDCAAVTAL